MKKELADIMKKENFIHDFTIIEDNKQNILRLHLKYTQGMPAISGMRRISSPGSEFIKAKMSCRVF
jgi:small subunit ribosomal protein S8